MTLDLSGELRHYYNMYQLLLFHFQQKNSEAFFELIKDYLPTVNTTFKIVFIPFLKYRQYIINALESPYSNAKLEATNKLIKDIKRNAFGYRNFDNFKKCIYLALNIEKEKTKLVLSRC